MIERHHPTLSIEAQCRLLSISRSSFYYEPRGETEMNLALMQLIDRQFLETPFYGVRQMTWHLQNEGHAVTGTQAKPGVGQWIAFYNHQRPHAAHGGYCTLCATGLPQGDVPTTARKHVPRYPLVSATLVGRLAVSAARQGERLCALLRRAYASASTVGSSMLVVDAINERAAAFYEGNGFVRLPDSMRLVLPMLVIERMLKT